MLLAALAVVVADRRNLGSSFVGRAVGPARATRCLRSPVGLATSIHAPAILGWLGGALILAVMMGAPGKQFVAAATGNPALGDAIGLSGARPDDAFIALTQLYLALIATGYAVQAVGSLRREETAGRLEPRLSGTVSRLGWLAPHVLVIVTGLVTIVTVSSLVLGTATAWSMGASVNLARVVGAGAAYLPAELLLAGLALALFGLLPRAVSAAWAVFAAVSFIALLGLGLKFRTWVLDLAPTTHVGNPPMGAVKLLPLVVLCIVAMALAANAMVGFRRRGVPQG